MRSFALLTAALGGACVDALDDGSDWLDVDTLTGELAASAGPPPTFRSADPGCAIRIVTFNVHYADEPEAIADHIRASEHVSKADVILIQESRAYTAETATRTQRIADALAMTWAYAPAKTIEEGGTHGNAILSRFPLENVAVRRLPYIDQPYHAEERNAVAADVVLGEDRLRVVNVHLDVRLGPVDRVRQLDPAVRDIDERLVLGGDFNTAPWAFVEALVPLTSSEAILGQEQAAVLDDFLAARRFTGAVPVDAVTMRIPGFDMRLDNLYSRGLPITAAGVEHVDGSDHWPVWFDVDRCAR